MSRKLTLFAASALAAGLLSHSATTLAQQGGTGQRPPAGAQPADLVVPRVSPELEQILIEWSRASAGIKKLQGEHYRFVYDTVFEVEKRAHGYFYYEAPDRGRIDLAPAKIRSGEVSRRKGKKGQPYKLQADHEERWICDGKMIWRINDTEKSAEVYAIPEESRGQAIMDGPLPFLFGLPPEKAKRRFKFTIEENSPQQVKLAVEPRLRQDAENWSKARIILKKDTWLPWAVQLMAPSGNEETVYTFDKMEINGGKPGFFDKWFGGNRKKQWFDPDLPKSYNIKYHKPPEVRPSDNRSATLPSVIGLHGSKAQKILRHHGCQIDFVAGRQALEKETEHTIYKQQPAAGTPLKPGQKVTLTYFTQAPVTNAAEQPPRTAANTQSDGVPSVLNLHWKDAEARLKAAGYEIEYLRGRKAPKEELIYVVYDQRPKAGTQIKAGQKVTLILYTDPDRTAGRE